MDLRTAALPFTYAPDAVTSIAVGASSAQQVKENLASLKVAIPKAFWQELKQKGLIMQEAQTDFDFTQL